ncbi:MAG TPA: GMC family oxidoreductase [Chloroflexia bacterium]|nr:GMC family oxidoreductase [Chloroflexia bacterium]
MAHYEADLVVVGAGVASLLVAWKAAEAGASVLVLEAGPPFDRAQSLQNYRAAIAKTPESPYPAAPYAPQPSVIALDEYYVFTGPTQFKSNYIRRVGGTTLHWLGTSMRFIPEDFQLKTLYGVAEDWPLTYEELEPWYAAAEVELGVAGEDDLDSPRSGAYPQPPLPLTYLDQQLALAAARVGLEVRPTPQARNSRYYDGRPPCCGNATCVPICPIGAKYDATVHLRRAQALGAQLLDSAVVFAVDVSPEGRVTQVRFKRPDGSEHSAVGKLYAIGAHGIETPKLLQMSRTDALPNGVANSSGVVGRYLMDHPSLLSWALANEPLYPYRSPLENSGIENFRHGEARRTRSAFRMAVGEEGWSYPGVTPDVLAGQLIDQGYFGQALMDELNYRVARQVRFANLIEQMPLYENYVSPAWDHLDAIGLPRPQIDYRLDPVTEQGLAEARRVSEQVFNSLGVSEIQHSDTFFGAGHVIGTYRMGSDPRTSVVDADQRTHDHPNLFLLGSGTFPTSGTANPTLTLAALSLKSAGVIVAELRL